MAKLPDIRFSQVSLPGVTSPASAVNEYESRQSVARSLVTLGGNLSKIKSQYDIGEASASVAEEMSGFEEQYAGKQTYTPDEVKALGLDDVVNTGTGAFNEQGVETQRSTIPAHEVYPLALQQASEQAIKRNADTIAGASNKKAWLQEMNEKHNQVIGNAVRLAGQNAYKATVSNLQQRSKANQELGRFGVAEANILAMPIPDDEKNVLLLENKQQASIWDGNEIINTGTDQELESYAEVLGNEDYVAQSGLTPMQIRALDSAVSGEIKRRDGAYQTARAAASDAAAADTLAAIYTGDMTATEVLERADILGYTNAKTLAALADSQLTSKITKTSPAIAQGFSQVLMQFETGAMEEGKTLDDVRSDALAYLLNNSTTVDPETGAPVLGIAATDIPTYMNQINAAYRASTESTAYKQVMENAKLRIANIAPGDLYDEDDIGPVRANLLAQFRSSLLDHINRAGNDPDSIKRFEKENLPTYLDQLGTASLYNTPPNAMRYAQFDDVDGSKAINMTATKSAIQNEIQLLNKRLINNPDNQFVINEKQKAEEAWLDLKAAVKRGELNVTNPK